MIYVVTEEVWSMVVQEADRKLLQPARQIDAKQSKEEAEARAHELASKFDHHEHEPEGDADLRAYWWGRNEGVYETHRFKVKPTVSD
jgi:hypothetical protein